jgi:glycoprotein endo-alpha-1,2-mannosidase
MARTHPNRWLAACFAYVFAALVALTAAGGEPLVGVYYYPWYGPGLHTVNQSLRGHLTPRQPPALGDYSSRDSGIISAHIDQSRRGNIDFWALSWWGPQSAENTTIRNSILAHPRRTELRYAIHYESTGRLGTFENQNYNNLIPDFRYLANNYFQNPNYLKVDGRPVVFMYLTRAYFNSQASRDAVAALRATIKSEFQVDPFIVGDDLFGGGVNLQRAQLWDAITDFDVYGTVMQSRGSTTAALNQLASVYNGALQALTPTDVGFIPTASPGFNDSGVRSGHPAAPRYLTDDPNSKEGDLFARMLNDVVVPRTDPRADDILMINSFNEWHEDTQIEPTVVAPRTDVDDSGNQRYTDGHFYEGYGNLYLDILSEATKATVAGDYNRNGAVDAADYVLWRNSIRKTGFGLAADGDRNRVVDSADYSFWKTRFGLAADAASAAFTGLAYGTVPEPAPGALLMVGILAVSPGGLLTPRKPRVYRVSKAKTVLPTDLHCVLRCILCAK